MNRHWPPNLALWAARDLLRHPAEAVLTGLCLAMLTALLATALLLGQGIAATAQRLLEGSPSLVVRRLDAGGWKPLPAGAALAAARRVPGIIGARSRIWGTAAAAGGIVTVLAIDTPVSDAAAVCPAPGTGEALVGPGVQPFVDGETLRLCGVETLSLRVTGRLDAAAALVAHDLVRVSLADARRLLGLKPDEASDLALEVFHEAEAEAIRLDLAAAFPWPVHITTRAEAIGRYRQAVSRRSGLFTLAMLPAGLSLCLLVTAAVREHMGRRREVALLKVLGWATSQVVRLQLYRALAVALPAVSGGALLAWLAVFWPGAGWVGPWLLGWSEWPPAFNLVSTGSLVWLIPLGALVLAPFLVAVLLPAIAGSVRTPLDFLTGGPRQ